MIPHHYDLYLFPELEEGEFYGKVDIDVEAKTRRDFFSVHIKYLKIESAKLTRNGRDIDLMDVMEYKPNEFLVMRTSDTVPAGNYTMHFGN